MLFDTIRTMIFDVSKPRTILALAFLSLLLPHCSKPAVEIDPEIEKLEKKLQKLRDEVTTIEKSIQDAESDPALKAKLQEDHKLADSRKERLKYQLKAKKPAGAPESEKPAEGHGGGGHH